mmetsp:Transcript_35102/g.82126  ORF Transcript_35102/g.82126 Transcript_35102/m.82126 type:complete len:249 (+) Transcript_35102:430-1176(+)
MPDLLRGSLRTHLDAVRPHVLSRVPAEVLGESHARQVPGMPKGRAQEDGAPHQQHDVEPYPARVPRRAEAAAGTAFGSAVDGPICRDARGAAEGRSAAGKDLGGDARSPHGADASRAGLLPQAADGAAALAAGALSVLLQPALRMFAQFGTKQILEQLRSRVRDLPSVWPHESASRVRHVRVRFVSAHAAWLWPRPLCQNAQAVHMFSYFPRVQMSPARELAGRNLRKYPHSLAHTASALRTTLFSLC